MRRLLLLLAICGALVAVPSAAASTTVRLALIHALHGCHVWGTADSRPLGASWTTTLKRGTKIEVRVSCPMDFDVVQVSGPGLAGLPARWQTGTAHTLVFAKRGVYRIRATNVESSTDQGLQTLGPDNTPVLTVRVR